MSYITTSQIEMRGALGTYGMDFEEYTLRYRPINYHDSSVVLITDPGLNIINLNTMVLLKRAQLVENEVNYIQQSITNRRSMLELVLKEMATIMRMEADLEKVDSTYPTPLDESTTDVILSYIDARTNILNDVPLEVIHRAANPTKGHLQIIRNHMETVTELLTNDLDQDTVRLQSVFGKRSDAFELASDLQKKYLEATSSMVNTITQ